MRVDISTILNCSAEKAWNEAQKSSLLLRVVWPLVKIIPLPAATLPTRWSKGLVVRCNCSIFGFIPLGMRTILFENIDHDKYEIQTREHDRLISRWDHRISIQMRGTDQAIYRDEIEINAGPLTAVVWAWANWFYHHRQSRWRALAKKL